MGANNLFFKIAGAKAPMHGEQFCVDQKVPYYQVGLYLHYSRLSIRSIHTLYLAVSTGAMGALAPAILKNRLLAPTIFGHFSTVGKNLGC